MPDKSALRRRAQTLYDHLHSLGPFCVAYSGGLDSRLLCHLALRQGLPVEALHLAGPHVPARESAWAKSWADKAGLPLRLEHLDPLQNPQVAENGPERCYYCKRDIFTRLRVLAGSRPLCDGSNASDQAVYRPGLRALRELGIISPLAQAGLNKADLRALARESGLDWPEQAARPCLLTRFDYGLRPSAASLAALEKAEEQIEKNLRELARRVSPTDPAGRVSPGDLTGLELPFRLRFSAQAGPCETGETDETSETGERGETEKPGRPLLHIACAPDLLDQTARQTLSRVLENAGFAGTPLECLEDLSGHFDRQRGLTATGAKPQA